ncbi:MAG: hypothetical protein NVV82_08430 [Sporocytophaga sp.]|nr:hypothetical protein [Sporocytophaga sp.]
MKKTDDFLINRLMWKAERYRLPTESSFYFKDLPKDLQQHLSTFIDLEKSGAPILFFTKSTKEWTVICTRQVICRDNKSTVTINIAEIHSIEPAAFEASLKLPLIKFRDGNHSKRDWDQLTITDKKSNRYILHSDKGSDLFALWNILLMTKRILAE